ncbi:hypothetical protein C8F01DRAFT_1082926 [Mycena amicta]|nr:hypothetical protein C8F01DRAFT_1082926 [Mycena amicta]
MYGRLICPPGSGSTSQTATLKEHRYPTRSRKPEQPDSDSDVAATGTHPALYHHTSRFVSDPESEIRCRQAEREWLILHIPAWGQRVDTKGVSAQAISAVKEGLDTQGLTTTVSESSLVVQNASSLGVEQPQSQPRQRPAVRTHPYMRGPSALRPKRFTSFMLFVRHVTRPGNEHLKRQIVPEGETNGKIQLQFMGNVWMRMSDEQREPFIAEAAWQGRMCDEWEAANAGVV